MFLNTFDDMSNAGKEDVFCDGALRSVDFLLKDDGMGFTLSDVRRAAGMGEGRTSTCTLKILPATSPMWI